MELIYTIAISLLSTIIFGIIDGTMFIVAEETLQNQLIKLSFFDENMAELATGGISTAIAIFIATFVRELIHKHYHILEHPIIDSTGIIIGTILLLGIYYVYKRYKEQVTGEIVNVFNKHTLTVRQHEKEKQK